MSLKINQTKAKENINRWYSKTPKIRVHNCTLILGKSCSMPKSCNPQMLVQNSENLTIFFLNKMMMSA
jgi:hypothetical protein